MNEIRIRVLKQEQYNSGEFIFDGKLKDVIQSLVLIKEKIPAEYQNIAECEITSAGGYEGSSTASISISYLRPKTEAELKSDLALKTSREEEQRKKELSALAFLKEKYGQ